MWSRALLEWTLWLPSYPSHHPYYKLLTTLPGISCVINPFWLICFNSPSWGIITFVPLPCTSLIHPGISVCKYENKTSKKKGINHTVLKKRACISSPHLWPTVFAAYSPPPTHALWSRCLQSTGFEVTITNNKMFKTFCKRQKWVLCLLR